MLNALKENCTHFRYHIVEGEHEVHLNLPERIEPQVAKFIRGQLRSL